MSVWLIGVCPVIDWWATVGVLLPLSLWNKQQLTENGWNWDLKNHKWYVSYQHILTPIWRLVRCQLRFHTMVQTPGEFPLRSSGSNHKRELPPVKLEPYLHKGEFYLRVLFNYWDHTNLTWKDFPREKVSVTEVPEFWIFLGWVWQKDNLSCLCTVRGSVLPRLPDSDVKAFLCSIADRQVTFRQHPRFPFLMLFFFSHSILFSSVRRSWLEMQAHASVTSVWNEIWEWKHERERQRTSSHWVS